jgi:hypothetical protein
MFGIGGITCGNGMRYTGYALLVFGLGLIVGLGLIAADLPVFGRVASGLMALGIAALPVTMLLDWRRSAKPPAKRKPKPRARRKPRAKPKPVASKGRP